MYKYINYYSKRFPAAAVRVVAPLWTNTPRFSPEGSWKGLGAQSPGSRPCSKSPCRGVPLRLLLTAEMIWQQELSYTHFRGSSTSPVNLGHRQCHCSSAASVTQTWAMKPAVRGAAAAFMPCGWKLSGGQYYSPSASSTNMKIPVWFVRFCFCTTLWQLLNCKPWTSRKWTLCINILGLPICFPIKYVCKHTSLCVTYI